MNPRSVIVLCVLLLQAFSEVHSLYCYSCISADNSNPACVNNPKRKKFEQFCKVNASSSVLSLGFLISAALEAQQSSALSNLNPAPLFENQCAIMHLTVDSKKVTVRACDSLLANCDNYRKMAEIKKWTLDSCMLCETELCNASSALVAGVYPLLACLAALAIKQ